MNPQDLPYFDEDSFFDEFKSAQGLFASPPSAMCSSRRITMSHCSGYANEASCPKFLPSPSDATAEAGLTCQQSIAAYRYDRKCRPAAKPSCEHLRPEAIQPYAYCGKAQDIQHSGIPHESALPLQYNWSLPAHDWAVEGSYAAASSSMTDSQTSVLYWNQYLPGIDATGNTSAHQLEMPRDQCAEHCVSIFECRRAGGQNTEQSNDFNLQDQRTEVGKPSSVHRPYLCTLCGKSFVQKGSLKAHRRTHSGEKPFSCPICHRLFTQTSSLMTHKRTHTGEKPYRCIYCVKAFSDNSTLTKHMRTHTGQKPYQCNFCTMKFTQSGNLSRHMKTHQTNLEIT
uniref:C2H2-type domain-containing protein n=1 Tax=Trichuris muris TaxID=70415 RepID=A0A5S6Q848_TRIMR